MNVNKNKRKREIEAEEEEEEEEEEENYPPFWELKSINEESKVVKSCL